MDKMKITSLQNAIVKQVKELQNKKAARKKQGLFVVEGYRGVKELPAREGLIEYLVVTEKQVDEIPAHLDIKKCYVVTEEIFAKISETQSPQGMLAVVKMPGHSLNSLDLREGAYIILENLQDPGNLGTIIRTAHAFGFKGVLMTKGSVDAFSPKVVRATMSALFYIPIIVDETIEAYVEAFKATQTPLYVTALHEKAQNIKEMHFPRNLGLIIGNEGNGVTDYCIEQADELMIIPMPGGAESLNASVAASICMYAMM